MIKGFAHFGSTYVYTNDKVNSSGEYNNCKYIHTQLNKVNINRIEGISKQQHNNNRKPQHHTFNNG